MMYYIALSIIILSILLLVITIKKLVNANNINDQLVTMRGLLIYTCSIIPILLIIEASLRYFNLY